MFQKISLTHKIKFQIYQNNIRYFLVQVIVDNYFINEQEISIKIKQLH